VTWPKIFHRVWLDEPERPEFEAWKDKLQELHPDWEIRTWGDSSELTWLRNQEEFEHALETDPFGRAPDILRYELLWRFGGVYIDTDFEPLRPFDALLADPRPFAGWENDRTMCTALLAAPPQHDAIDLLIRELPASLAANRAATPNVASGPEFATALWRERDDVRRLPPMAFYPVGWWEKQLLGKVEYPAETYAVHHWAKGWGKNVPTTVRKVPNAKVSILVPFRDVDGSRGELWSFVRQFLEREYPEAELVVASDDGEEPFHKTLALNRAAAEASGEILVLWDSDTLVPVQALAETVEKVAEKRSWGQPYRRKVKLSEKITRAILSGEREWDQPLNIRVDGPVEASTTFTGAPPFVMHREAWDAIHGADERFRGWGQEDQAMATALSVLVGRSLPQARGEAIHLYHPRQGRSGSDLWIGQTVEQRKYNIWLNQQYRNARRPEQMRALVNERMVAV